MARGDDEKHGNKENVLDGGTFSIVDTYVQSQPGDLYWEGPLRQTTSNVGVALRIVDIAA